MSTIVRLGNALEYQLDLTEKINRKIEEDSVTIPALGILIGEDRWLVPMRDITEILPVPRITPAPLTRTWFLGIINVRGRLYGVSDISCYMHGELTKIGKKSRVFLINPRLGVGFSVLVGSILGIRNLLEFDRQPSIDQSQSFVAEIYSDKQGRTWRALKVSALVQVASFLQIENE